MKFVTRFIIGLVLFALIRFWIKNASRTRPVSNNYTHKVRRSLDSIKHKPLRARRVFISHSWQLSSREYHSFVKNLRAIRFIYNHSIPRKKARHFDRVEELYDIFRKQMVWCSKVFVLANKDLPFDSYVLAEMDIASELGKEIIVVQPNVYHPIPHFIRRRAHHIIANDMHEIKRVLG